MDVSLSSLAFGLPGGWEWVLIALFGLLLFGKRLPEVGKSLGKSIVEFKKGLRGIEDDLDKAVEEGQKADMLPPPDKTQSIARSEEAAKTTS
jgi:sec-independent protein translocase protein TatA